MTLLPVIIPARDAMTRPDGLNICYEEHGAQQEKVCKKFFLPAPQVRSEKSISPGSENANARA